MAKAVLRRSRVKPVVASDLPSGLGAPAQRALAAAGISRLDQLTKHSETAIKQLHGIGPNALGKLRSALTAQGMAFKQ